MRKTPNPAPTDVRLRFIDIAGGDPHVAAALRAVLWQEYCDAGQPLGPSEEAMFRWVAQALQDSPTASASTDPR